MSMRVYKYLIIATPLSLPVVARNSPANHLRAIAQHSKRVSATRTKGPLTRSRNGGPMEL
jgi:hypothetical protein